MKSYLRFLSRNKLYTAIMGVGLSVSLAFVIIMSCYVWQQYSVGRQYPDFERTYCAGFSNSTFSSVRLNHIVENQIPEVEDISCLSTNEGLMDPDDDFSNDLSGVVGYLAISLNWFDMFPARFLAGNKDVLNDVNNVIVTESMAARFGGDDCVGKTFHISNTQFTIGAVIEDPDDLSLFTDTYRIYVSLDHPYFDYLKDINSYQGTAEGGALTFFRLKEGADVNEVRRKVNEINDSYLNEGNRGKEHYNFIRLDKLYLSDAMHGANMKQGNKTTMRAFGIIVLFLLVSAIFNYINLNTALAGKRSKEMATRMLLGDNRSKVMGKYIKESMLMTFSCMCFAFLIAKACLPSINNLINSPVPISIGFDLASIIFYITILLTAGLACAIIPGIISFRFSPISILKGNFRHSSKRTFTKIFIMLQNTMAIIIVAVSLVMSSQIKHMMDMPLNANIDNLYLCNTHTFSPDFEKKLEELPYVSDYGRTYGRPGQSASTSIVPLDEFYHDYVFLGAISCDTTAFRLYDFKVVRDYGRSDKSGVWLTESAVKALSIDVENPILPPQVDRYNEGLTLAGIIEDFALRSAINLDNETLGVVYVYPRHLPHAGNYIVRMSEITRDHKNELYEISAERAKETFGPNVLVNSGLLEDLIGEEYQQVKNQLTMVSLFMVIAIMLAVLGQIAMSTYFAKENEKEIGVRKVFGGTVQSESRRSIREYMIYCLIATVIAIPVAVYIAGRYLEGFQYRMDQKAWIYIAAALSIFIISFLAVLWQTLRAARTNPAEALKKE